MAATPLERALGTGSFLKLRGKLYTVSRLRLRHFAEAKAFIAALAPDPLKELRETPEDAATFDGFSPDVQKALAIHALELKEKRRAISSAEAAHWINGPEGLLFFFWVMVRNHHKEFATIESVFQAFPLDDPEKELSIAEAQLIQTKVDEMSFGGEGPDPAKKGSPAAKPGKKKKGKKASRK